MLAKGNKKVLAYGMIGGGLGGWIGGAHRRAAELDGKCQLTAGCFSRSQEKCIRDGRELGLPKDRLYATVEELAEKESKRKDGIDFAIVVTPNYAHYSSCKALLEKDIHVVCDKPLVFTEKEGLELKKIAEERNLLFGVTYTYSGYPMVKQARKMIQDGILGDIRMVMAEYAQGWMSGPASADDSAQGQSRNNSWYVGVSNCVGDIGTHIENTVSYITGLSIRRLSAKLDVIGEGRTLDTNASIMLQYDNGASGIYWCSQIAIGSENGLKVRIFGSKGTLEWCQENPNYLKYVKEDGTVQIMGRGAGELYARTTACTRLPSGHPEGYIEAFANIYSDFADALISFKSGGQVKIGYPKIDAGIQGVRFIHKCVESSRGNAMWLE